MRTGNLGRGLRTAEAQRKASRKRSMRQTPELVEENISGKPDYSGSMKVKPILEPEQAKEIGLDTPFKPYNHRERATAHHGTTGKLPPTMTTLPDVLDPQTAAAIAVLNIRRRIDAQRPIGAPNLSIAQLKEPDKPRPLWQPFPNSPQEEAYISEADELFYGGAAGGGKMASLDTSIPTIDGWTTMGDIQAGDIVFDEQGRLTYVIMAHPIDESPKSFLLSFDDGSEIKACADHQWLTFDANDMEALTKRDPEWRARRQAKRPSRVSGHKSDKFVASLSERNKNRHYKLLPPPEGMIRTTEEIYRTLRTKSGRTNHAIPVTKPLDLPEVVLPIDPYTLGAWLGDGTSGDGGFTGVDADITDRISDAGFEVHHHPNPKSHYILKLIPAIRKIGLYKNKHIPDIYLRASKQQRLDLLKGLMDTDGYVNAKGQVQFTNTNRAIIDGVHELIVSLGWKARIVESRATLHGRDCGPVWDIKWTPDDYVFHLSRKIARQKLAKRRTTKYRYIVDCVPIPPVPMRCITVDSPSHLYLIGRDMIPTHNSWLGLGCAITSHWNSLVMRREATQVKDLVADSKEIIGKSARYNGSINTWYFPEGRRIEFGGCESEDDKRKYKGRGKDLYVFDEVSDFLESQYIYITTWNRSARPGQRCRIICTGNPPTGPEGQWVIKRWAPWLDPTYPSPALPGELRWFATLEGKDVEVAGPQLFEHKNGRNIELIKPRSRTFIPARLEDNPVLDATDYRAKLQSLPEPWRSQLLYGDFNLKTVDSPWQVIPTSWIRAAMDRWKPEPPMIGGEDGTERRMQPLTALGVDVARGGADKTILAPRHGLWYDKLRKYDGSETEDAPTVVALILPYVTTGGVANIDGIGVGSGVVDITRAYIGARTNSILFSSGSAELDKTGTFGFVNLRAQAYWQFREALDPQNPNPIALPPDQELLTDLAAATYRPQMGGIKIESKEDIKKRLGRSPDCADAVVLASLQGSREPHIYSYSIYH